VHIHLFRKQGQDIFLDNFQEWIFRTLGYEIRDIITQPSRSSLTIWAIWNVGCNFRISLAVGSPSPLSFWANVPVDAVLPVITGLSG
jgi:hypothetical protein